MNSTRVRELLTFVMRSLTFLFIALLLASVSADEALLKTHCAECHNDETTKGKFNLSDLGGAPTESSLERWLDALDLVIAEEMPPEDDSTMTESERETLTAFLDTKVRNFETQAHVVESKPRRLNNREFANSVRDVLLLEDIGTHQPTANLIGDTLHHGFDTHGDSLGFSRFHLEQYIEAVRKIVDATILTGDKPDPKLYTVSAEQIARQQLNQNTTRKVQRGKNGVFDFLDPKLGGYFEPFENAPETGRYSIKINCTGTDRFVYDTKHTGFYHGDPIQLSVHLGDRVQTFDLPDAEILQIELNEWIAKGSRLILFNPTDAFRLRGNGNFKFQYAITPTHLKETDPDRYRELVAKIESSPNKNQRRNIDTWHNWVDYWTGARPQVFSAEIEGPFYETWPPQRQIALIGENPTLDQAATILRPIAERAWRKSVSDADLAPIVALVESEAETLDVVDALKEGIVAILVSPNFLVVGRENTAPSDRFATKLSYFLKSTIPDSETQRAATNGELESFDSVRGFLENLFGKSEATPFLTAFPTAWMELNDINFMSPDPAHYQFYHKKQLSKDMVNEVLAFFNHAIEQNIPIPEFLSADYSFINADLARLYGIEDVPQDSTLRKYTFNDGKRGGLLGMGAFLTATADSLATSPIHRAVYVMENFMGIHPTPPPPDVEIKEPDVRQARTIKEVLSAHVADKNCASCHDTIDPWGYAFESFDPTGAWRDVYTVPVALDLPEDGSAPVQSKSRSKDVTIPIDASAKFRNGIAYNNIVDFRNLILTDANRDRFVRCFITKLLTYANGEDPSSTDFLEIDNILTKSAENDYRIVDTIAAVVDSPLFRGS